MVRRITTGIVGLDNLIEGGLLHNSVNLLTGETGTGKTLFASQFIWHGLQKGETCVYITMEESPKDIRNDALMFGWDFTQFEKKGLFKIIYHDPASVSNISSVILEEIGKLKASRLVIDSISIMALNLESAAQIRRRVYGIINSIKKNEGCTSLLISEIPEGSKAISRFSVEEFVVDSIIILHYLGVGEEYYRSLQIRKMRRTNHGKDVYPITLTKRGIIVKKPEI